MRVDREAEDRVPVSVRRLLPDLLTAVAPVVGERMVGVWLYGSAATGSFERGVSDVDVLIGVDGDLGPASGESGAGTRPGPPSPGGSAADNRPGLGVAEVRAVEARVLRAHPGFRDRLDLTLPAEALAGGLLEPLLVLSPGEPAHLARVLPRWALTRALVRATGLTLAGRPAREALAPAEPQELRTALIDSVAGLRDWAPDVRHRGGHAYLVLTACRALRTLTTGELADKAQAAQWAAGRWPRLRPLLEAALAWRRAQAVRDGTPLPAELAVLRDELLDLVATAAGAAQAAPPE
ncbi:aminoglycoside adenylyltransferase domain-containing protein [Streptomyces sp. NPDC006552]|uniref:aminoglycoside adenylyltransferase domain-containing protein n=1 Tax=Streptomyces sp. NPDC006552 TaxID=3157179 RepID=UPI0033B93C27